MELDSITARRRLAAVAAHFPATSYDTASTASLVPLVFPFSLSRLLKSDFFRIRLSRFPSSRILCSMMLNDFESRFPSSNILYVFDSALISFGLMFPLFFSYATCDDGLRTAAAV